MAVYIACVDPVDGGSLPESWVGKDFGLQALLEGVLALSSRVCHR